MASLEIGFEDAAATGTDAFFSTHNTDIDHYTVSGMNGTSKMIEVNQTGVAGDHPYGKVTTGIPAWDGDTDFRCEWFIDCNNTAYSGGSYKIRTFQMNAGQDIQVQLRMNSSTDHALSLRADGIASTDWNTISSSGAVRIGWWFESTGTTNQFDCHLLVGGSIVETELAQTYTGGYTITDFRFGAPTDISTDRALTNVFYIDEIRMNNTGEDPFAAAAPAGRNRTLMGVGL